MRGCRADLIQGHFSSLARPGCWVGEREKEAPERSPGTITTQGMTTYFQNLWEQSSTKEVLVWKYFSSAFIAPD